MSRRAWHINTERQDGVLGEPESLHQYRKPRSDFRDTDGGDGDGFAVGRAGDAQAGFICIQRAQALKVPLYPSRGSLPASITFTAASIEGMGGSALPNPAKSTPRRLMLLCHSTIARSRR